MREIYYCTRCCQIIHSHHSRYILDILYSHIVSEIDGACAVVCCFTYFLESEFVGVGVICCLYGLQGSREKELMDVREMAIIYYS